jgi:predicted GH43/DUF377 family glycosyl hydrolase
MTHPGSSPRRQPLLQPETLDERISAVPDAVFPLGNASIGGRNFVFFGIADAGFGVALLKGTGT